MTDFHLTPSDAEQRQQQAAHTLLGEIYAQAHRDDLPSIAWSIETTGVLNGRIDPYIDPSVADQIFRAWTAALDLQVPDGTPKRAMGQRGQVPVQVFLPSEQETAPWR